MLLIDSHKAPIKRDTFLFEYTYGHLDSSFANALYPTATNFGKRVNGATHDTAHPFAHNKVGARRCLAPMGTWLE